MERVFESLGINKVKICSRLYFALAKMGLLDLEERHILRKQKEVQDAVNVLKIKSDELHDNLLIGLKIATQITKADSATWDDKQKVVECVQNSSLQTERDIAKDIPNMREAWEHFRTDIPRIKVQLKAALDSGPSLTKKNKEVIQSLIGLVAKIKALDIEFNLLFSHLNIFVVNKKYDKREIDSIFNVTMELLGQLDLEKKQNRKGLQVPESMDQPKKLMAKINSVKDAMTEGAARNDSAAEPKTLEEEEEAEKEMMNTLGSLLSKIFSSTEHMRNQLNEEKEVTLALSKKICELESNLKASQELANKLNLPWTEMVKFDFGLEMAALSNISAAGQQEGTGSSGSAVTVNTSLTGLTVSKFEEKGSNESKVGPPNEKNKNVTFHPPLTENEAVTDIDDSIMPSCSNDDNNGSGKMTHSEKTTE